MNYEGCVKYLHESMQEYYYVSPTQIFLWLDDGVNVARIAKADPDIKKKKKTEKEKENRLNRVSHSTPPVPVRGIGIKRATRLNYGLMNAV